MRHSPGIYNWPLDATDKDGEEEIKLETRRMVIWYETTFYCIFLRISTLWWYCGIHMLFRIKHEKSSNSLFITISCFTWNFSKKLGLHSQSETFLMYYNPSTKICYMQKLENQEWCIMWSHDRINRRAGMMSHFGFFLTGCVFVSFSGIYHMTWINKFIRFI